MFVRTKTTKIKDGSKQTYAYLVDNRWNPLQKKVQQKAIATLGNVSQLPQSGMIEKIIKALDRFATNQGFSSLSQGIILDNLDDETKLSSSYDWGSLILARHLLSKLKLKQIITSCHKQLPADKKFISAKKLKATVEALLAHHLQDRTVASERKTHHWYSRQTYSKDKVKLTKDDFYRSLDVLIENQDEIERQYWSRNQDLFNQKLNLVLFDTTSIYYWGERGKAALNYDTYHRSGGKTQTKVPPPLLSYGFSKDKRGDLKQVVVGVLMTPKGIPIAHQVFSGNQPDVISLPQILDTVKKKYDLEKIIFITDKGMVSEKNLTLLEESGHQYIVGVKIRQLPPELKAWILDWQPGEMTKIKDDPEHRGDDNRGLFIKDLPLNRSPLASKTSAKSQKQLTTFIKNLYRQTDMKIQTGVGGNLEETKKRILKRRYLLALNTREKTKQARKRQWFKRIIARKVKTKTDKDWLVKNGYKKYLKINNLEMTIDNDKLKEEAIFDGKWLLLTNINQKQMTARQAGFHYKSLATIERGFRDLKSLINLRPIYHFTEKRIKAHIFVAFLSLILKWYVYHQLSPAHDDSKPGKRFIEAMVNLKAVAVDESIPVYVRTALSQETIQAMKELKMKVPGKVIIDNRNKAKTPPVKAGRPKKQPAANQQSLFTTS